MEPFICGGTLLSAVEPFVFDFVTLSIDVKNGILIDRISVGWYPIGVWTVLCPYRTVPSERQGVKPSRERVHAQLGGSLRSRGTAIAVETGLGWEVVLGSGFQEGVTLSDIGGETGTMSRNQRVSDTDGSGRKLRCMKSLNIMSYNCRALWMVWCTGCAL